MRDVPGRCPDRALSGQSPFTTRCSGRGPWREHEINQEEFKDLLIDVLDNSYACENAVSAEKSCTFRVGKSILQREIPKSRFKN